MDPSMILGSIAIVLALVSCVSAAVAISRADQNRRTMNGIAERAMRDTAQIDRGLRIVDGRLDNLETIASDYGELQHVHDFQRTPNKMRGTTAYRCIRPGCSLKFIVRD